MRWTATAHNDAYGIMTMEGVPTAACLGKELFAQHVRHGDWVTFPGRHADQPDIDAIVARSEDATGGGRLSGVFVNTGAKAQTLAVRDWEQGLQCCREVLRLDTSTGDRIVREPFDGAVRLEGYGIAVASTAPCDAMFGGMS